MFFFKKAYKIKNNELILFHQQGLVRRGHDLNVDVSVHNLVTYKKSKIEALLFKSRAKKNKYRYFVAFLILKVMTMFWYIVMEMQQILGRCMIHVRYTRLF